VEKQDDLHELMMVIEGGEPIETMAGVTEVVAKLWNITLTDLVGAGRAKHISWPRYVAIDIMRRHHGRSFPQIAAWFNRDHTTIMHAAGRINTLRLSNPPYDRLYRRTVTACGFVPCDPTPYVEPVRGNPVLDEIYNWKKGDKNVV
jgi:hypothetical protein